MADKKITELNSVNLPLTGSEEIPIVQDGETKKVAVSEVGGESDKGYKELTFSFIGNGTGNPTFIELKNDFGVTFTTVRDDAGTYTITTSSDIFNEEEKEAVFLSSNVTTGLLKAYPDDTNIVIVENIDINNGDTVDFFGVVIIEIRVYD